MQWIAPTPKVNGAYPTQIIAGPDIVNNDVNTNEDDQLKILTGTEAVDAITSSLQLFEVLTIFAANITITF